MGETPLRLAWYIARSATAGRVWASRPSWGAVAAPRRYHANGEGASVGAAEW